MSTSQLIRALVIAALSLACCALVWVIAVVFHRIPNVMTIVVFSILFSYLIYPMVKVLSRRLPRAIAVAVVYAGIFVAFLVAVAFLVPTIVAQSADFAQNYPTRVSAVEREITTPGRDPLLQRLPPQARALVAQNAGKAGTYAGAAATAIGARVLPVLRGSVTLLTELAVMFGVTFMFIVDLEKIQATLIRMFPRGRRDGVVGLAIDVDRVIGGFVRSQVILSAVTAISTIVVLAIAGVPYAVILGLLIGLLGIIPVIGALVGAVPAVIVALVTVGLFKAILVTVVFAVIFQVIGNLVAPLINAKSVGVTPLIITLAILIGGEAYGILGILLSVPIAGIARVFFDRIFPADPEGERLVLAARSSSGDVTQLGDVKPVARPATSPPTAAPLS